MLARLEDDYVAYLHAELLNRLDGKTKLLIYDIAVAPEQRRRGIATKLMQAALALGREVGAVRCWLLTEVENAAARGLYEKLGGDEWSAVGFGWRLE
ncbi:MAG: GNAT family N-acetyltransferase [bacterium]|nr:GNAT family N-acetyltransferase [bacterium]